MSAQPLTIVDIFRDKPSYLIYNFSDNKYLKNLSLYVDDRGMTCTSIRKLVDSCYDFDDFKKILRFFKHENLDDILEDIKTIIRDRRIAALKSVSEEMKSVFESQGMPMTDTFSVSVFEEVKGVLERRKGEALSLESILEDLRKKDFVKTYEKAATILRDLYQSGKPIINFIGLLKENNISRTFACIENPDSDYFRSYSPHTISKEVFQLVMENSDQIPYKINCWNDHDELNSECIRLAKNGDVYRRYMVQSSILCMSALQKVISKSSIPFINTWPIVNEYIEMSKEWIENTLC